MEVKIISYSENPIKSMWFAARNCYYTKELKNLLKEYNKKYAIQLLTSLYNNKHLSIFEQNSFQFMISNCSRSLLAQLTRHRVGWSYAAKSQHYQLHEDFTYKDLEHYNNEEHKKEYYELMETINKFYKKSIKEGCPRYIAREVLPNSASVNIVATTNLRALIHFWNLRLGKENTPEIRVLAEEMQKEVFKIIPELKKIIK